eukprot:GAFH01005134.1.p1 GENE.GAFH01005134.1~~GAFH01005134.1.p1  ORF type:complete len:204 (-),score=8.22 GAFH01005134.1:39-650(-)
MTNYGDPNYWDSRYTEANAPFDWYLSYEHLRPIFAKYARPDSRILHIGCGNSRVCDAMYDDGYHRVTNIDISDVVIHQMRQQHNNAHDGMTFERMDVRKLDFPSESFQFIFDKGTVDAILCGTDSYENLAQMNKELSRVLAPGGVFVSVSYGLPENRLQHFENTEFNWTVVHEELRREEQGDAYHVYVMTKRGPNVPHVEDDE